MTRLDRTASAQKPAIIAVDPTTDARWESLLDCDAACLFHSPPWLRAVADAYSFEMKALLVVGPEKTPLGGIAFSVLNDMLGRRVIAAPFSDACGPLLRSGDVWPALFAELQQFKAPVNLRILDSALVLESRLVVTKRARWHTILDITDAVTTEARFEGPARRALRKAEREGVVVRRLEGAAGPAEFHRLHVALRRSKYRLLAQPLRFFQSIRTQFDRIDGWFLLGAFVGGQLVAATVYLRWRDTLYYKFNASRLDALAPRPNNSLVAAGIALARSLGCRRLDLGPSDDDQPGLIRFKRQFGASERELTFLRYTPPEWQEPFPQGSDLRRMLGGLSRAFTAPQMPYDVTARAGALLYRFFV